MQELKLIDVSKKKGPGNLIDSAVNKEVNFVTYFVTCSAYMFL